MDQLPLPASPTYATWLIGQSVAVVLLVFWVISLLRQSKRQSDENRSLRTRNDALSDSLVELVQSRSQELLAASESRTRSVLEKLESALTTKRGG